MPTPVASPKERPRRMGGAGHLVGSAVLTLGTFLPWMYSGDRPLDVYDLRLAAHRLELLDEPWFVLPVALVPLALAASLLARWLGAHLPALLLAGAAAAYTAVGAWVVARLDADLGPGPLLSSAGALIVLAAMPMELRSRPGVGEARRRRPRRPSAAHHGGDHDTRTK